MKVRIPCPLYSLVLSDKESERLHQRVNYLFCTLKYMVEGESNILLHIMCR